MTIDRLQTGIRNGGFGRATRGGLSFIVLFAALAITGLVLWRLRLVVLSTLIAFMIAAGLDPVAVWSRRHGVRRGWFAGLSLFILVASSVLLAAWMVPQLWSAGSNLAPELSKLAGTVRDWLATGPLQLTSSDLQGLAQRLGLLGSGTGSSLLQGLVTGAVTLAEFIEGATLSIVFSVYFILEGEDYAGLLVETAPERYRRGLSRLTSEVWGSLGAYARAVVVNGAINASMLGMAMWLLRIPGAAQLAVIAFMAGLFPVIGTITAGALAALVALASKGIVVALVVVGVTTVVHHLELYVIGPQIVGRWTRLHPIAVVAAVAIGASLAGVIGIFLAPPLVVLATAVWTALRPPAGNPDSGTVDTTGVEVGSGTA